MHWVTTISLYGASARFCCFSSACASSASSCCLACSSSSGQSSALYLQNVVPTGQTANQELLVTIALCEQVLAGRGAVRVHGGGFGGTAQAFVPLDMLDTFKEKTEAVLGAGSCHVVTIRPVGGTRVG